MKILNMSTLVSSTSLTYTLLVGASSLYQHAKEIDNKGMDASEEERIKYLSYISGSVMQSVAALESEVWSVINYGPTHHLGSNNFNIKDNKTLKIVSNSLDKHSILTRYDLILQLLKDKTLNFGIEPIQSIDLLIKLRNEITHYKSLFSPELDRKKLFNTLNDKKFTPPSFYINQIHSMNFFPRICLNIELAKWGVKSSISFINYFYSEIGVKSSLEGYNQELLKV